MRKSQITPKQNHPKRRVIQDENVCMNVANQSAYYGLSGELFQGQTSNHLKFILLTLFIIESSTSHEPLKIHTNWFWFRQFLNCSRIRF